ncbi:hypothetical protein LCGC14_1690040, partial [marine sediment metagenome]
MTAAKKNLRHINKALRPLARSMARLVPNPANERLHDDLNLDTIRASLEVHGQQKPIVLDRDRKTVRAGSGTLLAARSLGWTWIAAIVYDREEKKAKAFGVTDNRSAELATWDDAFLAAVFKHYGETEGDYDLLPGWSEGEIETLLAGDSGETVQDVAPEPPAKPMSKVGEVYELGPHRLMCGDA